MASKHCIILLLFFVAVTIAEDQRHYLTSKSASDPFFQMLGRFAVNEYNKGGKSHLNFIKVYGGYYTVGERGWSMNNRPHDSYDVAFHLDLTAANCSQSEAVEDYTAVVIQSNIGTLFFGGLNPKIN